MLAAGQLRNVTSCSAVEQRANDARIADPGNDGDRKIRIAPSDCVEAFEAVHARHLQIEQQQIDRRLQRKLVQRGLEVAGLHRHDLGIQQLEKKSQPFAKQRMVVGVQNFHVICAGPQGGNEFFFELPAQPKARRR